MCDKCGNKASDDVKRAIYYGVLKQILKWSPIKNAIESGEVAVEGVVGSVVSTSERSDKSYTVHKMAVYALASYTYENFLYKKAPVNAAGKILGMCPCEVYRDLYILAIEQLFNVFMLGFNVKNLVTDTISIFGAARMEGFIEKIPGSTMASAAIDNRISPAIRKA